MKTKENFKNEVIVKLDKQAEIKKQLNKNNKIFKIVCQIGKPRIFKNNSKYYINESGSFLHANYKPFKEYDKNTCCHPRIGGWLSLE